MSTATLPALNGHAGTSIDAATLEKVVCDGDLSRLSTGQRVQWYRARCDAAGLDPRTQPFQYVSLSGKLVLYATKTATDQLIAKHDITVKILSRSFDPETGIYEVHCSAAFPNGRTAEDIGAVFVGKAQGEMLANLYMKAVSKGKRRTVLSACGLGMLDETEVDTIPGAVRGGAAATPAALPPPAPRGKPAPRPDPEPGASDAERRLATWEAWSGAIATEAEDDWQNEQKIANVDKTARIKLCNAFSLTNFLVSHAIQHGFVIEAKVAQDADPAKRDKVKVRAAAAWAYGEWPEWCRDMTLAHLAEKRDRLRTELGMPHPDSQEVPGGDDPDCDPDDDISVPGEREPGQEG